jgi:Sugar phosphate isomerases/epimerases
MSLIHVGFNCNCFTNRYTEPQEWTRLCREMDVDTVMFNIDLIDPYWPWDLQKRLCDETLDACAKNGVRIFASFGGHHGHQHYLGHPDQECRREAEKFFRAAIKQTAYLGGKSFGTCFAIQTVRSQNDSELRQQIMQDALGAYKRLAEYGADLGLEALAYEMTSIPRETCCTFEENDQVLAAGESFAIPLRVCLDLGHRFTGGFPEEADHLAWIRRYGKRCNVVDGQQTDLKASRHWPFTEENNRNGVIKPDQVIQAIHESGAEEVLVAMELRTASFHPQEYKNLEELQETIAYWKKYL